MLNIASANHQLGGRKLRLPTGSTTELYQEDRKSATVAVSRGYNNC